MRHQRVVIYQNKQSISVNGEYRGKSMLPCTTSARRGSIGPHPVEKGDQAESLTPSEKKGIRKMIYQTAWRREDGTVGGIIELSMPIPAEMPHYVRG